MRLRRTGSSVILVLPAFIAVVFSWIPVSGAIALAPIYWNSTNPIFKISKNDHIIDVNPGDQIDLICPHYHDTDHRASSYEYYLIYRVSKAEYDDCAIYDPESDYDTPESASPALFILNCSNPLQRRRFTILFEPFQSIPNVPEYKPGRSYYFISTSSGEVRGLQNQYLGACYYNNMKLTVRVCCDSGGSSGATDEAEVKGAGSDEVSRRHLAPSTGAQQQQSVPRDSPASDAHHINIPVTSPRPTAPQPGHRTTHRRKNNGRLMTSTVAAPGDHWPRDFRSTPHFRHNGKNRPRPTNDPVLQPEPPIRSVPEYDEQIQDSMPSLATRTYRITSTACLYAALLCIVILSAVQR